MMNDSRTQASDSGQGPGPSTLCVHGGTHPDPATGGVNTPIFASTAHAFPNPGLEPIYPRYFNTTNQRAVAKKVALLEKGEAGLVFGSGMAAISTLLLSALKPGDHAVFQNDLYGGTHHFVTTELARLGVEVSFAATVGDIAAAIRSNTKAVYVESPSNPLLRCLDLKALAALCKPRGVMTMVDNTFATPINQNPIESGIDAVLHSATKYLNGHSDLNAGVVVSTEEVIQRLTRSAVNYGGMLDASACYQLERGLKTLALRIERHNGNAGSIARFLRGHPSVSRVNYPGLEDHPDHTVASRQMRGFGGMLSFELKDPGQAGAMLGRFRIVTPALSLGGVETLVCVPSATSHRSLSPDERKAAGISEGLIRVSAGIEDIGDLIADFGTALEGA
ncbi:MAG: Cys/Met metabolism pyridoxal-phosphate-dependent enzyme [Fibrobacteres bacterium]|nr:Cys/Met metabolism pyridoxal-phosphate-dependent enzyme [Fibrobacterota bacterium]